MALPSLGGGNLTSADVLAYAQRVSETGTDVGVNMCQRFVRMAFGSAGGAATAVDAWRATPDKHTKGTPPPGTAVYWGGGAGHTAISAGNGWVYTTDWAEPGKVSLARIDDITTKWGKPLLGWTGQTNERKITKYDAKPVEGVGAGNYDPVYAGNSTTTGGGVATGYSKKELREKYGYIAEVYAGVPEIQKLVNLAEKGKWSDQEFERRFEASKWYKNHTEEERQFVVNMATNPAEMQQRINQKATDLRTQYRQLGVPVGKARLEEIATASIKHGWTAQQERNALVGEFDYNPDNTFGGVAGSTVDQFRQMSQAYVTPISNKTLEAWTENVLRGEATPDDFKSFLVDQAKSQWDDAGLHAALDRGLTVDQYLNPYRETTANTLGVDPDSINWLDPKWSQAVFHTDDKGKRGLMSLADWNRTLRTDSRFGYDGTQEGVGQAANFTSKLASLMGG